MNLDKGLAELTQFHINVDDQLPEHNEYVLAHLIDKPWSDINDPDGKRFFKVVKFVKGISIEERNALPHDNHRKPIYSGADEEGNNLRPYNWVEFGPGSHFGQDVDYWIKL